MSTSLMYVYLYVYMYVYMYMCMYCLVATSLLFPTSTRGLLVSTVGSGLPVKVRRLKTPLAAVRPFHSSSFHALWMTPPEFDDGSETFHVTRDVTELLETTTGTAFPVVILPGFGNDAVDYSNPLNRGYDASFQQLLACTNCFHSVHIVPIKRTDWLQIIAGVFSLDFWRNQCKATSLFKFYCTAADETIRRVAKESGKPVILVGHSAGGWLARALLGDGTWMEDGETPSSNLVLGLVTLGTPHFPPLDKDFPDMTRGALKHVSESYPGAFLSSKTSNYSPSPQMDIDNATSSPNTRRPIFYLTVAGTAVRGNATAVKGSMAQFASDSYLQVTGDRSTNGEEVGDGIVPLRMAHLSEATQVTLPGVWHSIQAPENRWYGGDPTVIDAWLQPTLALVRETMLKRLGNQQKLRETSSRIQDIKIVDTGN